MLNRIELFPILPLLIYKMLQNQNWSIILFGTKTPNMQYYFKAFQNYANFEGRASRSEYWYFVLFNVLAAIAVIILGGMLKLAFLYPVYLLVVLLPGLAVAVRRMHDVGKSGWFVLIPIYNFILACTDGDKGDNKYGLDPKLNYFTE